MSSKTGRFAGKQRARKISRLLCGASLGAVSLLALPSAAQAQNTRYWDANGAAAGSGGTGNWNTTSALWSESNSDVLGPYRTWVNNPANPDNAIFGTSAPGVPTSAGTITLTAPITVHNLTFQSVNGWVLDGGTLTLAGLTPTMTVNANTTINSTIAGTAGLTKAGGSTLSLTGTNTFSGGITLNGGSLVGDDDAAFGNVSNTITTAAGTNVGLQIQAGTTNRTVTIGDGGRLSIGGVGVGSAIFQGNGNLDVGTGVTMSNDANTYDGVTRFFACNGVCSTAFTSVRNIGEASSLGAPTTVANGTIVWSQSSQYTDYLIYTGDGDTSNRNWVFNANSTGTFRNKGTGTLTLTGDFTVTGGANFVAEDADLELLGVLGGNANMVFTGGAARNLTLGGANTYSGVTTVTGGVVNAPVLADSGAVSTFGTGSAVSLTNGGFIAYTGAGTSSNRSYSASGTVGLLNNGTGALTLSGPASFIAGGPVDTFTFGGDFAGTSVFSGVISGTGNLASTGTSVWELTGASTRTGTLTVDGGTLRAGSASAFGTTTGVTVNGGTLDLNGFDLVVPELSGTGGSIALNGGADLIVSGLAPANNTTYAGRLTGDGGLVKRGTSTLTLAGQSSYTGATTLQGGTLALDFAAASAPTDDIIGASSPLILAGGTLTITGADGETNGQSFGGLNVTAGTNRIVTTAGAGGTMNVNLGALANSGGLLDFTLPASGSITTTNPDGAIGWATVNGRDYAQVSGGVIGAFTAYVDKDDAATWANGEVVSDDDGDADGFSGTVTGNIQLGGLQYTTAQNSVVGIGAGNTLGIDGTIIVANTVGNTTKGITGGSLTGPTGGGTLGFLHNGGGTFLVSSQITDNGGNAVGITKAGTGTLTFNNNNNSHTGATVLSGGIFQVTSIGNGGANSALGASSAASANLVLESGRLSYNGVTATTDRGFTLVNGGPTREIEVFGTTNLTFSGLVTSPDDAGFTKIGAGTLTLSNATNDYVGVTRIEGGVLSVNTLANGGQASGMGAASSDSTNLVLLNGGTLQYTGGSTSIDRGVTLENAAGRIDVSNAATELTVGGAIVGAGRLEKYGDGTLVLTGASTYTGITVVDAGTLRAGAALADGSTTGVFGTISSVMTVNAGATLDLADNSNQIGGLNGGGSVTLGASAATTLTIGGGNSGTPGFTGAISGAGNVTHTNGTQVMTGCGNSYTGITTLTGAFGGSLLNTDCIQDGGVNSGIGASGSDSANLVLQNSGVLNYTALATDQVTDRGFTLAGGFGAIQVSDAATTLTFTGAAVGVGGLLKRGAGTLVLSGDNTYTGTTSIEDGRLVAGSAGAFDQGTGVLVVGNAAGAVFDLNGFDASFAQLQGGGTTGGTVDFGTGNATLTLSNNGNNTFAGTIIGSGNLIKNGGSAQLLTSCASTYDGTTRVNQGVLQITCLDNGGAASSIGASSADAGNLVLGGGVLRYVGSGNSTDRLFTLGGASQIDASGSGALVFTNTGPIAFANPGTNQTITLTGTSTADNSLAPLIANNGAGTTSLTKAGVGTWILTDPANTYTGVTSITGGVLGVDTLANGGQASSIGQSSNAAANLVIGSGGTLRYTGDGDTTDRRFTLGVGTTSIESVGTGAVVFNNTGAVSYTGSGARVVSLGGTNTDDNIMGATIGNQGANVTSLAKNGSGTWVLTGNNTYTGSTVINDGNLVIGNGGTTGNAGTGNVIVDQATSTLSFNRSDTLAFTSTISGAGGVAQIGTGTTVLTGANSYAGGTTISDGTLQIGNGGTTGSILGNVATAGDGVLAFNRSDNVIFGGIVSGTGSVRQTGGGTTVLTGVNTYSGGTLISGGTLQVSSNANLGSAGGGITFDGGTLNTTATFTSNRNLVLAGAGTVNTNSGTFWTVGGNLTGAGSLTKTGAGTLILTGDATHTGGTTISDGTLQIGNTGVTGSIAGDILNNAALVFNRSANYAFDGVISGSGSVSQNQGTLTLTADSSYGGSTSVNAAQLRITAGNTVSSGGATGVSQGGLTVSGPGSTFETASIIAQSGGLVATVNVENGGAVRTTAGGLTLRKTSPVGTSAASLNISGATSLVDLAGAVEVAANAAISRANITISDGGTLQSTGANLIGFASGNTSAPPSVAITGAGSDWTSTGTLAMSNGTFSLLAGGTASFASATIGSASEGANLLVSGANSTFTTTGDLVVGAIPGGADATSNGTITLADAGRLSVGGTFTLANAAGSTGTLNIGGAGAPVAAGVLDAAALAFGPGTGSLVFNHTETNYGFATAISGAGTIRQVAGVTRLTGDSSGFTGTTAISGGTFLVDGTLGDATSVTSVLGGGTLGGSGTIGGDVFVGGGATLAPGGSPGALTINGNLGFSPNASLDFEFGLANAPGNPLNDVVNVGGDLDLDGTLNVAVSPGGSFGIGLYRVINYAGALTDNGLDIGALPAGVDPAEITVQTSIAGQVNLINATGVTLNFWDGAAGPKFNNVVNGGDGVWQNSTGNDNWTDPTGAVNAPFTDDAIAIFSAAPGTVTIDNGLGAVSAGGMQFASDGYVITGDGLTLVGAQPVIRVGDGSAAGAGYTATIESDISGAGDLVKTDLGTLVLTGAGTFAGDVYVSGGEVRLSGGGTLSNVNGLVGPFAGDQGTVTVTGNGSTWTNSDQLWVGYDGTGTLNIADGGRVVSNDGSLGVTAGSLGQILVTGAGSSWQTSGRITVGLFGAGSLRIENGATVSSDDGIVGASGQGDVVINGPGSTWVNATQLNVGSFGTGTMRIENGASVVSNQGFVGANATGNAVVTGAGSTWLVTTFNLTVGNQGDGSLSIEDGGRVRSEGGIFLGIGAGVSGTLALQGTAANRAVLETSGFVGGAGAANVSIDGGLLRATGDNATFFGGFTALDIGLGVNGAVVDTDGFDIGISPRFVGAGGLTKDGAGTLTLTGDSTYAGGTTIAGGTLQLGDGGTTGSIVGDVANHGALIFNRADEVAFAGTISGTGGIRQAGSGSTILSAGNSYAGATEVASGTLLVNGDQSAATGLTTVDAGATLGGTGTIGGDVAVAGTLAPGDVSGPGTLTVNGNLSLAGTASLAYEFGQSDVVGGPLNDLIQVGGDLALDGTIDVAVSPGGSFDVGVYRVISYGGTLTDNGLDLGAVPAGTLVQVQTSVAGQVNLVNATGTTLNFWDGAVGPKADGAVNGGDGIWQSSTGNNNWTEASGTLNAGFTDAAFAIFSAAPGTVSVDNSLGAVRASGMQFVSDGYTITGGDLTLVGPQSLIRVGDGTAAGQNSTATIESALIGASRLIKTDLGTLVLTGTNSYTGGTLIDAGTLSISSDANLGAAAGGLAFDGGVLNTTADITSSRAVELAGAGTLLTDAGTTLTLGGALSGTGALTQQGAGTLVLAGAGGHTGGTTVSAGTLFVNGNLSGATGAMTIAAGATLGGTGTIGGDVTLADGATLAPGADGVGTLSINGALGLGAGTTLDFQFGQANAAGGGLNDLVSVGGDLILDGAINVSVPAGGSFGGGIYRVFDYGGTLVDNGLTLGTLPAGSDVSVQTAIAGQVNLVNTAGLDLSFWDGAAGPKNNNAIDGGDGVWRVGGGSNNWTELTGAVNADYAQGSFAVFAGAPGAVTIDDVGGAVRASGLQFAVGGYTLAGDALTLTGPQATIRVGDGTAAGAGYTATIASELTGTATLVKTDAGTLVLTGTNSYSGGTAIEGGTVRIGSDANLGAAAGGLSFDGGTLNTTASFSSDRAVNLVGTGTLLTDAGTMLTLTGATAGAGSLTKSGTGTLTLAGIGGHTGVTNVTAGTLLVNGNYAAATGATTVASGASLGGTGTIGGNVTLADGAILTPGAGGAGTLTISGNLALSGGTRLAYEFGQANSAGGALNDLVNVGGGLTLDGTIDVAVPAGGSFDVGVYRVFNYGGALTNNGLALGALPADSEVSVQTSIAGQVNLVNTAGLTLSFWDGAAGPKNNGVINGGDGTWQAGAGNDNWTEATGAVNASYDDGTFAIFGGTGGTVTVDNSLGAVTATGMQFASNGYTISGGDLTLVGPQSTIRVGDGSTGGAGFTATIDATLGGATQLVKTDAGTLVLGGTNSYTGGTLVNGGTVQISADANLGAATGDLTLDGGTLETSANVTSARDIVMAGAGTISTASGTTFTFDGLLSGAGALTKAGAGTLVMTGNNAGYLGSTRVEGTLAVNGSLCGDVNVRANGRLQGTGTVCTTVNAGTVAPGNSIGTLTVAGSYTGNNGTLEIEAELGGDASPTDRLVVTGGTAGATQVVVVNTGGLGAQTSEGIKIVDVTGGSSRGTFTLRGDYVFEGNPAVIAGAYGYRLFQGGVSTPADGDWYLRSALLDGSGQPQEPLYQPGVPLYESYANTLQTLNGLPTLQERVGNRQWSGFTQSGIGMWGRIEAARLRPEAAVSTSGADVNTNTWELQVGFDAAVAEADTGTLIGGINARYGTADARIRSRFGNGGIDTKGYGLGATLTWYGAGGFYADAQAQVSWFDSDLDSDLLGTLVDDNDGSGEAFSLEVGQRLPIGNSGLSLTPQAQIIYSGVRFDEFVDPGEAHVSAADGDSLRGRLGLSVDHQRSWQQQNGSTARTHLYGFANLEYEMLDGTGANVSATPILRRDDRLWGELGIGGSYSWADGRFTLFSEVSANTALSNFGDSNGLRANAGFRMRF